MKENICKRILAEDRVAVGHMIMEFGTRGMGRMLGVADLDFVLIDMEHASFSTADVANLIAWTHASEVAPFVRVPQIEYHLIARILDAGALGVMIPNVKTGAEARAVVDAVKYAPLGNRGAGIGGALTGFRTVSPAEFIDYSNRNTTVICQIESVEGLANLDEIASTPGVDILWVGHTDLSLSIGIPGQFQDPRFLDALAQVAATAKKYGRKAGIQPGNAEQARQWMGMGYNVISYSSDYAVYLKALTDGAKLIRSLAGS
jgi:2-dehydro-3-deoxyglucarate aldolase/4-hydroxy-2-oxoheptanedioate aldolase